MVGLVPHLHNEQTVPALNWDELPAHDRDGLADAVAHGIYDERPTLIFDTDVQLAS
jgi:hypothetical protein